MTYSRQEEAITFALGLIKKLPHGCVWALSCTDDDDGTSPSTLNIYTRAERWQELRTALKLGNTVDEYTGQDVSFMSFRHGTLHISLIDEE